MKYTDSLASKYRMKNTNPFAFVLPEEEFFSVV
jgi:hypothetical protein